MRVSVLLSVSAPAQLVKWGTDLNLQPAQLAGLENDLYVRKTDGYLPTAEVAFIDEIFKANSAILNALLTLLNERMFDNGNERLDVPLLCLVRLLPQSGSQN